LRGRGKNRGRRWLAPGSARSTSLLLNEEKGPRPVGARPIIVQNLKDKHKHTVLALCNGAEGRQKSNGSLY
jgi:hypothetical protein